MFIYFEKILGSQSFLSIRAKLHRHFWILCHWHWSLLTWGSYLIGYVESKAWFLFTLQLLVMQGLCFGCVLAGVCILGSHGKSVAVFVGTDKAILLLSYYSFVWLFFSCHFLFKYMSWDTWEHLQCSWFYVLEWEYVSIGFCYEYSLIEHLYFQ